MKIEQDVRPIPGCWLEQKLSEIQQKKVPRAYDEDELARITRKEGVASWYLNQFCRDKRKRRQNTSCEVRNAEKATTRYPNTTRRRRNASCHDGTRIK